MGLMAGLEGMVGGAVGAELMTAVSSFIQQHGGVQGVVSQLEQQGLGGVAKSWVGGGPNQPISAAQIAQAFSHSGVIGALAAKTGMSPQDLTQKLSQLLPTAIDKLTPQGTVAGKPS
jgi:uncharacterized protein YidB (DUF937 family)